MSQDALPDPIPSEISEFMEFFHESLADLKFPDVDLETLEALSDTVKARARELAHLNEQVRVARDALEQAREELDTRARRGLAYMSVYAEGDAELTEEITGLSLAQEQSESKPVKKKKGRGRGKAKNPRDAVKAGDEPTGELPFEAPSSEAA